MFFFGQGESANLYSSIDVSNILKGKLAFGAITINSNILRYIKPQTIFSSANLKKDVSEEVLMKLITLALTLEKDNNI